MTLLSPTSVGEFYFIRTKFCNQTKKDYEIVFNDIFLFAQYKLKKLHLKIRHIAHIYHRKFYNDKVFISSYILNRN